MSDSSITSPSLLGRVQASPRDQLAWREFELRYAALIQRWCKRWGMQNSDADDLTQDVMLALSRQMQDFQYDPSRRFRSWLKTIAHRAWCDFLESQRKGVRGSGDSCVLELLERQDVQDDFSDLLEAEWKRELLETALIAVRQRVQPHTWQAFEFLTQEQLSGAEVAEKLQMKVGAVWVAGSKVRKMIEQEVKRLESIEQSAMTI